MRDRFRSNWLRKQLAENAFPVSLCPIMQVTVSNTRIDAAIPQRQLSRAAEALSAQACVLVTDFNGQQTELPSEVSELISQVVRVMQEEDRRERFRGKNLDDVFDDLAAVGLC